MTFRILYDWTEPTWFCEREVLFDKSSAFEYVACKVYKGNPKDAFVDLKKNISKGCYIKYRYTKYSQALHKNGIDDWFKDKTHSE